MSWDLGDYLTVPERMRLFFQKYPNGSLKMDPPIFQEVGGKIWIIGRAFAYRDPEDTRPGVGTCQEEIPGTTPYTRNSEVQNLETSCWGRALAAVGIGIDKGVATMEEVRRAKSIPEDDEFYTRPLPETGNRAKPSPSRKINGKQVGLLKGHMQRKKIPDDQVIPVINALLVMGVHEPIDVVMDLDNGRLDYILENLHKVDTVDEFLNST